MSLLLQHLEDPGIKAEFRLLQKWQALDPSPLNDPDFLRDWRRQLEHDTALSVGYRVLSQQRRTSAQWTTLGMTPMEWRARHGCRI